MKGMGLGTSLHFLFGGWVVVQEPDFLLLVTSLGFVGIRPCTGKYMDVVGVLIVVVDDVDFLNGNFLGLGVDVSVGMRGVGGMTWGVEVCVCCCWCMLLLMCEVDVCGFVVGVLVGLGEVLGFGDLISLSESVFFTCLGVWGICECGVVGAVVLVLGSLGGAVTFVDVGCGGVDLRDLLSDLLNFVDNLVSLVCLLVL